MKIAMKKKISADYQDSVITCACGNVIETLSTKPSFSIDICPSCHPFYTGQQKIIDMEGRVERFQKRYGLKKK